MPAGVHLHKAKGKQTITKKHVGLLQNHAQITWSPCQAKCILSLKLKRNISLQNNIWTFVKVHLHKAKGKQTITKTLWINVKSCWDDISQQVWHKLVESMPGRMHTVNKVKEGHTTIKKTFGLLSDYGVIT